MSWTSLMRWVKKKKARIPGKQKSHTNGCRTLGRTRGLGEGSPSQKTGFGKAPGAANAPRRSLGWPTLTNAAHDEEFAEEEEEIGDFI